MAVKAFISPASYTQLATAEEAACSEQHVIFA
jgi:hypothetical protein